MENPNGNEQQPQQPNPDDLVLVGAQQMFANLVHKMVELQRKVNELETAKLLQQGLIDSQQHRIEILEGLLRGERVQ